MKNLITTKLITIKFYFIYSIDNDEERVMYSGSDNIEIMINDEADEVIKQIFDSLKNSEFALDYVHLLYYKCHKKIRIRLDYIQTLRTG